MSSKIDIEVNDELDFEVGDSVIVIKEDGTIGKIILPEMGVGTTRTAGYKKLLDVLEILKPGSRDEFIKHHRENGSKSLH